MITVMEWGAPKTYDSILNALVAARVFGIYPGTPDGTFDVYEECDGYFYLNLTKDQLLELAEEIRQLAEAES